MDKHPFELERYIAKAKRDEIDGNATDYKTTSEASLERIEKDAIARYKLGEELIAKISKEDLARCRKLYDSRQWWDAENLRYCHIDGKGVLVPAYISLIEEVRSLVKILS